MNRLKPTYGSHTGAVSLSFDDGTTNQLEKVVPALKDFDIKGTFYLHARDRLFEKHEADWREVARLGHEIGNHTRSHLCPNAIHGSRVGLEELTLDDIEADILEAQRLLQPLAPHQDEWTFCYPCGAEHVGSGENRRSYAPIVAKHFLAGRGAGEYGFGVDPETMDRSYLPAIRTDRMSGFEMIGLVEDLTASGKWVILCFHDISGARISVEEGEFRHLLKYLDERRDRFAVAPIVDVMKMIVGKA